MVCCEDVPVTDEAASAAVLCQPHHPGELVGPGEGPTADPVSRGGSVVTAATVTVGGRRLDLGRNKTVIKSLCEDLLASAGFHS